MTNSSINRSKVTKLSSSPSCFLKITWRLDIFILVSIFVFVVLGSLLLPYDFYNVPQPDEINFIGRPPAWGRPFGETGMLQLDVMTLVANGGRTSLTIGFATAIGSITIGTLVGVIAGFIGGKVDHIPATIFSAYPKLNRIHDAVRDHAGVKSWYAKG